MIVRDEWYARQGSGKPYRVVRLDFDSQAEQVAFLREMVNTFRATEKIRYKAVDIVFNVYRCQPKKFVQHAAAIGDWVQKNIRYVNEGEETYQTPIRTLEAGFGDCDDHTTLVCSLCESIGIPTQLIAMYWRGGYRHIFPRAIVTAGGRQVTMPLDTTLNQPIAAFTNPLITSAKKHPDLRYLTA